MSKKNIKDLKERINEAMRISSEKMIQTKKKLGQKLVVSENSVIKIIEPT
jgi:hypothetical protein